MIPRAGYFRRYCGDAGAYGGWRVHARDGPCDDARGDARWSAERQLKRWAERQRPAAWPLAVP